MTMDTLKNTQEELDIKVKFATPDDWEKCKKLRLLSIKEYPKVFGATPERVQEEQEKNEEQWRKETCSEDAFSVLAWNNQDVVGLGRSRRREGEGVWNIRNAYVKPKFHNMGIQQKMIALRLSEIIRRGGKKVVMGVEKSNSVSMHNAEKFGFKVREANGDFNIMQLDLTNPEVVRKINEVLD
jgi:ribosomal protein S18 acetylase RimI-like enzyme